MFVDMAVSSKGETFLNNIQYVWVDIRQQPEFSDFFVPQISKNATTTVIMLNRYKESYTVYEGPLSESAVKEWAKLAVKARVKVPTGKISRLY
jgi:hypothetical protein